MRLDLRTCYIICRLGIVIDCQYQKPIFKSKQITLGIQRVITLGKKELIYFFVKNGWITSEIYVNQVFQPLSLLFFEKIIEKKRFIIQISDSTTYHISKLMIKFCCKIGLLRMKWPIQSLDFNPIKNLQQIIKIRVNSYCYQIYSAKKMKIAIKEK